MKIRTDFVSNSSSSSFILARKGELTEKQKEAIVHYVETSMMGKPIPLIEEGETWDDYQKRTDCWLSDNEKEVREAQKDGMTVYGGWVDFECCDYSYSEIFQDIWNAIEEADNSSNFRQIDTDLTY